MLAYPGFWRMGARYWKTGLTETYRSLRKAAFVRALQRLVPETRAEHLKAGGAGVRAQAVDRQGRLVDDFRIEHTPRAVHVRNAPSPAATASLEIGRRIAALAVERAGIAPLLVRLDSAGGAWRRYPGALAGLYLSLQRSPKDEAEANR